MLMQELDRLFAIDMAAALTLLDDDGGDLSKAARNADSERDEKVRTVEKAIETARQQQLASRSTPNEKRQLSSLEDLAESSIASLRTG